MQAWLNGRDSLVVVRGSGEVTRKLSAIGAAAGTRVLAHADGGGVLYLDASADPDAVTRLITESTDRLGVCNRLNLLLIDRPAYDRLWPVVNPDATPGKRPTARLEERWQEATARTAWRLGGGLELGARADWFWRWSRADALTATAADRRLVLTVGWAGGG